MKNMSLNDLKKVVLMLGFAVILPFLVSIGFESIKGGPQNTDYQKAYFYTTTVCGIIFACIGIFLHINFIGAGPILGGLITMIFGIMHTWNVFSRTISFLILLGVFLLLLAGSYYVIVRSRK